MRHTLVMICKKALIFSSFALVCFFAFTFALFFHKDSSKHKQVIEQTSKFTIAKIVKSKIKKTLDVIQSSKKLKSSSTSKSRRKLAAILASLVLIIILFAYIPNSIPREPGKKERVIHKEKVVHTEKIIHKDDPQNPEEPPKHAHSLLYFGLFMCFLLFVLFISGVYFLKGRKRKATDYNTIKTNQNFRFLYNEIQEYRSLVNAVDRPQVCLQFRSYKVKTLDGVEAEDISSCDSDFVEFINVEKGCCQTDYIYVSSEPDYHSITANSSLIKVNPCKLDLSEYIRQIRNAHIAYSRAFSLTYYIKSQRLLENIAGKVKRLPLIAAEMVQVSVESFGEFAVPKGSTLEQVNLYFYMWRLEAAGKVPRGVLFSKKYMQQNVTEDKVDIKYFSLDKLWGNACTEVPQIDQIYSLCVRIDSL